jgi:hypothetical protein
MRLKMPQIEKPISWVDMTNSHWSVFGEETDQYMEIDSFADQTYTQSWDVDYRRSSGQR